MRIGILSDIHGNFEALRVTLAALDALKVDRLYCLGDIAGYYTQVNECCDELRQRDAQCVLGNHDWYLISGGVCRRSRSVNDCLSYQRKIISQKNLSWLSSFPVQRITHGFHMVHGGWDNPIDEYVNPTQEYFADIPGAVFLSGHTHVQRFDDWGAKVYCNPGSVGQPRDGDPRAAFAVYDQGFHLHRIPYDIERVGELMSAAGFEDYYYGGLQTGASRLRKP